MQPQQSPAEPARTGAGSEAALSETFRCADRSWDQRDRNTRAPAHRRCSMKSLTVSILLILCAPTLTGDRLQSEGVATAAVGDPVNIRHHGATGDGSTDDTFAVVKTFSDVCGSG